MAATKKATTKKRVTPAKKAVAKKPASKSVKTRAKSKPVTTVRRKKAASTQMQSFKVAKSPQPFLQVKIGEQTLYWAVLAFAIFALGLWVLNLNLKVQELYNQIDQANLDEQSLLLEESVQKAKAE